MQNQRVTHHAAITDLSQISWHMVPNASKPWRGMLLGAPPALLPCSEPMCLPPYYAKKALFKSDFRTCTLASRCRWGKLDSTWYGRVSMCRSTGQLSGNLRSLLHGSIHTTTVLAVLVNDVRLLSPVWLALRPLWILYVQNGTQPLPAAQQQMFFLKHFPSASVIAFHFSHSSGEHSKAANIICYSPCMRLLHWWTQWLQIFHCKQVEGVACLSFGWQTAKECPAAWLPVDIGKLL